MAPGRFADSRRGGGSSGGQAPAGKDGKGGPRGSRCETATTVLIHLESHLSLGQPVWVDKAAAIILRDQNKKWVQVSKRSLVDAAVRPSDADARPETVLIHTVAMIIFRLRVMTT
eukprot:g60495.t1